MHKYTSIDLFSGPGGLCTGFKWAGIKPLIAVEMSYWTTLTYQASHDADILPLDEYLKGASIEEYLQPSEKTLLIRGDITKVSNDLIKQILKLRFGLDTVDVVTGGAPCESFSLAGDRKENDERNNLFLNILRIARGINSPMILFENVKGLLSKKQDGVPGKMYETICEEFESVDKTSGVSYQLASRDKKKILLKASDYGVPQDRERIFLVGINSNFNAKFKYPEPTHGPGRELPYVSVGDAIFDLPEINAGEENSNYDFNLENVKERHRREFLQIMRGILKGVPDHIIFDPGRVDFHKSVNHKAFMIERMSHIKQGESMRTSAERLIATGNQQIVDNYFPKKLYGARNRRLVETNPSFTVTSHCLDEMIHPRQNRQLTPREVARLQSFPDWYVFEGPYVKFHSDPEQDKYEQIGDAIPPLLAYALGVEIAKTLDQIYANNSLLHSLEESVV